MIFLLAPDVLETAYRSGKPWFLKTYVKMKMRYY